VFESVSVQLCPSLLLAAAWLPLPPPPPLLLTAKLGL